MTIKLCFYGVKNQRRTWVLTDYTILKTPPNKSSRSTKLSANSQVSVLGPGLHFHILKQLYLSSVLKRNDFPFRRLWNINVQPPVSNCTIILLSALCAIVDQRLPTMLILWHTVPLASPPHTIGRKCAKKWLIKVTFEAVAQVQCKYIW